jgi:hypothetical protein
MLGTVHHDATDLDRRKYYYPPPNGCEKAKTGAPNRVPLVGTGCVWLGDDVSAFPRIDLSVASPDNWRRPSPRAHHDLDPVAEQLLAARVVRAHAVLAATGWTEGLRGRWKRNGLGCSAEEGRLWVGGLPSLTPSELRAFADLAEESGREAGKGRMVEGALLGLEAAKAFGRVDFVTGAVLTARAAEAYCEGAKLPGEPEQGGEP